MRSALATMSAVVKVFGSEAGLRVGWRAGASRRRGRRRRRRVEAACSLQLVARLRRGRRRSPESRGAEARDGVAAVRELVRSTASRRLRSDEGLQHGEGGGSPSLGRR